MSNTAAQLDAEIEALKPVWEADLQGLPACRCGAWNVGECGCGNYVPRREYMQARQVEYLRSKLLLT